MMLKKILITAMAVIGTNSVYADMNITINEIVNNVPQTHMVNINSDEAILYARSGKESYVIGESIGIEIKLRKDAYMYFWSIGKDSVAHLILPNDFESYNVYKKNMAYTVPEISADYNFVSNHVGVEEVYVLASPNNLTQDEVEKIMLKNVSIQKNMEKPKKCGIMVIAKKPNYDIVNFKIIIYGNPNEVKNNMVVKIESNPYGLE